jgi:hypothetical protein
MGSLEDLFIRVEQSRNTTYQSILNWLSDNGKKNKDSFRNVATQLQEPFAIKTELDKTTDYDKLRTLKKQANNLDIAKAKNELVKEIDTKMEFVSKDLSTLMKQRAIEAEKEKRQAREKAKLERELERVTSSISSAKSVSDTFRIENNLRKLEREDINTESARTQLNDKLEEIETEKERQLYLQREARLERESNRERGIGEF